MKWLMLVLVTVILCSCSNSEKDQDLNDKMTIDSLPEGEWNGEYIEVKDSLAEKTKPKKKSHGSEYYNMGKVEVSIDTVDFSIDLFDQKKNHITISENSLTMRIKSAQRDFLSIRLAKPGIVNNYSGTYVVDPDGSSTTSSSIDFNRLSNENSIVVTMMSGKTKVESFSPRLGKIVLRAEGTFEDKDGNKFPGVVDVNMRFESVVSTYNPNS